MQMYANEREISLVPPGQDVSVFSSPSGADGRTVSPTVLSLAFAACQVLGRSLASAEANLN